MNKKNWIAPLALSVMGMASISANAAPAGPWHGVWLSLQESAQLVKGKAPDWSGSGPYDTNASTFKLDSGKGNCYWHFVQIGAFEYRAKAFCNVNGVWERDDTDSLWDLSDGRIGTDWVGVYVSPEGSSSRNDPQWLGYEGTLILKAKMDAGGEIKSVQASSPSVGMFWLGDDISEVMGTGRGSFKVKFVPTADVPAGAIACQVASDGTPAGLCD